ncbi:MAG: hypothetical protein PF495_18745 [Spirochaetales bacterium]|jgi:hypothetical protein|nr:hypothetical protein [Spirochaetales bacterium]
MKKKPCSFDGVKIINPKLYKDHSKDQVNKIYSYYAGYSNSFARNILMSMKLNKDAVVFDPWNGSGTTTTTANEIGFDAIGFDLNPVMVLVAKAEMLSPLEYPSLVAIAKTIVEQAIDSNKNMALDERDPLLIWFDDSSAGFIRSIELKINKILIMADDYRYLHDNESINYVSPLAAFFYIALFKAVRDILSNFVPSNPTWTKKPKSDADQVSKSMKYISSSFMSEVISTIYARKDVSNQMMESKAKVKLEIGNAEDLDLEGAAIDLIVSSPPYCTRIDYAISTSIELAILQYERSKFDKLRRAMTGTSTVEPSALQIEDEWGPTCINFLDKVYSHKSKASSGYYFKNHVQYYSSIFNSLKEISRVLKHGGAGILVAQDSCYKELHNDVPGVTAEMAKNLGLHLVRRDDFESKKSMSLINTKSNVYSPQKRPVESVLCFVKT